MADRIAMERSIKTFRLDHIADKLEQEGALVLALALDQVSDRLDRLARVLDIITIEFDEKGEFENSKGYKELIKNMGKERYSLGDLMGAEYQLILDFSKCPDEMKKVELDRIFDDDKFRWSAPGEYDTTKGRIKYDHVKTDEKNKKIIADIFWDTY